MTAKSELEANLWLPMSTKFFALAGRSQRSSR